MTKHDVIASLGKLVVKGEGKLVTGEPIDHALGRALPGAAEWGQPELAVGVGRQNCGLVGHIEGRRHDPLDALRGQVELVDGLSETFMTSSQALAEFAFDLEHLGSGLAADSVDGVVV